MKKFKVLFLLLFVSCVFTHSVFADCSQGYGVSNGSCVKCSAGWYSVGGTSQCIKCGAGTYSSAAGSTGCDLCPPGTYAPEPDPDNANSVNTSCQPCPNGKYAPNEGTTACADCGDLYVSPDKTSCGQCPAGNCCYRYNAYVCNKGTYAPVGENVSCRSNFDNTCARGSGSGTSTLGGGGGNNLCTLDPISTGVRKGACKLCDPGWTTAGVGATDASDCNIRTASSFASVIDQDKKEFGWPDDGSILEQTINSPKVSFSD